jgi:LDH2 family malate/lactate/ureidoglycolate dehydrogenase
MAELFGDAVLGEPHELNWFVVASDLSRFRRAPDYFDAAKVLREKIETCPPADGVEKVMWPGQPELESKSRQGAEGIDYSVDELNSLAPLEARFSTRLVG